MWGMMSLSHYDRERDIDLSTKDFGSRRSQTMLKTRAVDSRYLPFESILSIYPRDLVDDPHYLGKQEARPSEILTNTVIQSTERGECV